MSNYTVVWSNDAQDQLTTLWLDDVANRDKITQATHLADSLLSQSPFDVGQELHEGLPRTGCATSAPSLCC